MLATVADVQDFVVDVVLGVDPKAVDTEDVGLRLHLPGVVIARTTARSTIWLTAVVEATAEAEAAQRVRDHVLAQLSDDQHHGTVSAIRCAALGELYAWLDPARDDPELEALELMDLVEDTLWCRPPGPATAGFDPRPEFVARPA